MSVVLFMYVLQSSRHVFINLYCVAVIDNTGMIMLAINLSITVNVKDFPVHISVAENQRGKLVVDCLSWPDVVCPSRHRIGIMAANGSTV